MLNNLSVLENLNTLYVEDDKITKDIVSELLQNFFPNLISVSNGECAYNIYKKEKIDLIITDLEMPKLGGLDLISKIRTENYHLPIIVFTAYTDKKHLMPCANFNIQGYLEKPITSQKLKTIFENILT
ncbi:response regulator [Poseidonibacter ostreae]|jgi:CheY-like chemotaxis protein|uniref:Response regulator n=1 Tax=Poseidonibacter ostreae TaxID=2654171 RepID=A0A6L4WRN8_9BACT|nr:response regulator [Poseidonibacter ostreae]KAB7883147.1 response regulator [Poseidonibacter ostreae]KAB7885154.1 response regulator [Poseidonibacter ostreae]KAB7887630.1 response regulator [Poseidonibacter ostreae]